MLTKSIEFKGLYPALMVGFNADNTLDLEGLKENVKYLMAQGCAGMCVNGSTGEAAALTREERVAAIKAAREAMGTEGKIIAGAGASMTAQTIELVQDAKDAGADAALVLSPIGNTTDEGLVKHYEAVAEVGIPIVLYNHPGATGIDITIEKFDRLIQIPNVIGMKETSGSMPLLAEIFRKYGDTNISIFTGADDLTLPVLAVGAKAIILATANVAPKQVLDIMNAVENGDIKKAREVYYSIAPLTSVIGAEDNFPAGIKKAVELLGRPSSDPRMPILPMPEDQVPGLVETLKIAGLL